MRAFYIAIASFSFLIVLVGVAAVVGCVTAIALLWQPSTIANAVAPVAIAMLLPLFFIILLTVAAFDTVHWALGLANRRSITLSDY